ncbi:MAG: TIGR04500 family putative peptide maturation system protein, partial [Nonomuraea sp.]|nr:TIGR04500 family putative peptide maturation system protein [Nonomuraea sp.]
RLVTDSLVREELEQTREPLSDTELQAAMDAFRRARGLLTGAATRAWMDRNRITHQELEELVALEAAVAALRARVAEGRVADWFAEHRAELDVARVAQAVFTAEPAVPDAAGFFDAVERAFADGSARPGAVFATLRRGDLDGETAERIFAAPPGTVAGPFPVEHGHLLVKVLEVTRAVLDDTVRDLVERRIFSEWIERRRAAAKIEWFWGIAERTAGG